MTPLFDCLCQDCGREQERIMSAEAAQTPCAHCGGVAVKLAIQPPGFRTDHTWDS